MIEGGYRKEIFETFFISKEIISNPLISEIIDYFKILKKRELIDEEKSGIISIAYGKRMIINGEVEDYSNTSKDEIIEVADYDPIKNNLLIIGKNKPKIETPLHWMIHHARSEINFAVQLNNNKLLKKLEKNRPLTDKDFKIASIDMIKDVMKKLKNSKIVILKNHGVLFVGNSKKEVDDLIKNVEG